MGLGLSGGINGGARVTAPSESRVDSVPLVRGLSPKTGILNCLGRLIS